MKRKNKRFLFTVLAPLAFVTLLFFAKSGFQNTYNNIDVKNNIPLIQAPSAENQDVPDKQEKEPVYISIFKFIINCNPFKQKKAGF